MASLNRVFLMGNLTRNPEIRYIPSGKAVGDLRLAANRRYKTASGEDRDEVCYVDVVVWGRQAETCGQYLTKGAPVLVEGRLHYEEWEKNGQKHNRLRIVADRVQFMGSPRKAELSDAPSGARAAAEPVSEAEPPPEDIPPAASDEKPSAETRKTGTQNETQPERAGGDDDDLPF